MLIRVENVSKEFGKKNALGEISFQVNMGEIFGVLGRNGAGKTVLINIMTGLIDPSNGEVLFEGKKIGEDLFNYKSQINLASSHQSLQLQSNAEENLNTFAGLYGIDKPRKRVEEMLDLVGVKEKALRKRKLFNLSSGELTRINLAKALLNRPRLLFLDEPTAFLDPVFREELMEIFIKVNKEWGTTIIFSSHQLSEVKKLCDRVLILKNGNVSYVGRVKDKDLLKYY